MISTIGKYPQAAPFLAWALALMVVAVFATCFMRLSLDGLRASDDNIWLYFAGVQIDRPKFGEELDRQLLAAVAARGSDVESHARYEIRANYDGTYFIASWILGQVAKWSGNHAIDDPQNYAKAVGKTFIIASAATAGLVFLLVLAGILATRRPQITVSFTSAVFMIALAAVPPWPLPPNNYLFFGANNYGRIIENILSFLVNSGPQFLIFGFTPRSFFFVLALLVFAWRWREWWIGAYALAACAVFLHRSLAGVLITTLVALDLWFRPTLLRRVPILLCVLGALSVFMARESLWAYILPRWQSLPSGPILGMLGGLTASVAAVWFAMKWQRKNRSALFFPHWSAQQADILGLIAIWVITAPVVYVISQYVNPIQGTYFWYQLHARLVALYEPVVVFGAMLIIVNRYWPIMMKRPAVCALGALTIAAILIAFAVAPGFSTTTFMRGMESVALEMDKPILAPLAPKHEAAIYLAMARSVERNHNQLATLLQPVDGFDLRIIQGEPYLERCEGTPKAVVVWLHTWSADMLQIGGEEELRGITDVCLISPNFNGIAGSNPQTCGSSDSLVRIRRVIDDVRAHHGALPVVLAGVSGGGMHALLTLGTYPDLVQAASIWMPIYNLARWYEERPGHRAELETCLGGPPTMAAGKYLAQSPRSVLSAVHGASIIVNLGTKDVETPPWHARMAVEQMRVACPDCRIHLREWEQGHTYQKDVLAEQLHDLIQNH